MSKSRKAKKYNPDTAARRGHKLAKFKQFLETSLVGFYIGEEDTVKRDCNLIDYHGECISIDMEIANMMMHTPFEWSVLLCVFHVEKGKPVVKRKLAVFNGRHYQEKLMQALNDLHYEYIEQVKKQNVKVTGVGWLASPVDHQFDCPDETGRIFKAMGAI